MMKFANLIEQIKALGNKELLMAMRTSTGKFVMYVAVDKMYAMDLVSMHNDSKDKTEFFLGKTPDGSTFLDVK